MKKIIRKLYSGANGTLLCTMPKEAVIALNLENTDSIAFQILSDKEILIKKVDI